MINFLNLKYFLELSNELNFRKAAANLNITQQSLSGHIKKLEENLKVPLISHGGTVTLTPAGVHLKKRAKELLLIEANLQQELLDINNSVNGSIRIGATSGWAQFFLPSIIKEFHRHYPLVKVDLYEGTTAEIEKLLTSSVIDISIGFIPVQTAISSTYLYDETFKLVIPNELLNSLDPEASINSILKTYNLPEKIIKTLPFLLLSNDTKLGEFCSQYFSELSLHPSVFLYLKNIGTMIEMCSIGLGCIICTASFIEYSNNKFADHQILSINKKASYKIGINQLNQKYPSQAITAFIDMTKNLINSTTIKNQ